MLRQFAEDYQKPILRLTSLDEFESVPAELRAEILKNLGVDNWDRDNFDIHIISEDEKYAGHYSRRVTSLYNAAIFLLDNIPRNKIKFSPTEQIKSLEDLIAALKQMSKDAFADCVQHINILNSESIAHYQNSLDHYCGYITSVLSTTLGFTPKEVMKILDRAEQFSQLTVTRPAVCTVTNLPGSRKEYSVQIDTPLNPYSETLKLGLELLKSGNQAIPLWYSALNDYEKAFLKSILDKHDINKFGTVFNSISSKLRLLPAPSNYGKHMLITYTTHGKGEPIITTHTPEIRSSHIASRDVSKDKDGIRHLHAIENFYKEIEDAIQAEIQKRIAGKKINEREIVIPILYQTLISPVRDPDTRLNDDRNIAIDAIIFYLNERQPKDGEPNLSFFLITTNHPLNYARILTKFIAPENLEALRSLEFFIRKKPTASVKEVRLQIDALEKLKKYNIETTVFNSYRELYFSTMEQIIVGLQGGITIGSCVSGKDRKAIEIIHTDAMKIYYTKFGSLPPLYAEKDNDDDKAAMARFAEIFAELYCTKHQALMADFNAPGSFGTKTPSMYLPKDLQRAIRLWYQAHFFNPIYAAATSKRTLKESDILATNNDINHIKRCRLASNETDLSWNPSSLIPAKHLINAAILSFDKYQAERSLHLGFFASIAGSKHGEFRAACYETLFRNSKIATLGHAIILYALLTTTSSKTLNGMILERAGISDIQTAINHLQFYFAFSLHNTNLTMKDIEANAAVIRDNIEGLTSLNDINKVAEIVKGIVDVFSFDNETDLTTSQEVTDSMESSLRSSFNSSK